MFSTLVQKELKLIIQSPKFLLTFLICFVLVILSVFIGINEYKAAQKQYETVRELDKQDIENARSWMSVSVKPGRKPSPLQIFTSGTNFDVGRYAFVSEYRDAGLEHSFYSDDPVFAVFRNFDFSFIVTIVFSLLAILYTYNSINGEREEGTLKLLFANSIPKAQYILAKITGIWLGLIIPVILIILISLLLIILNKVPVSGQEWILIISHLVLSILYFTFFIILGVLFSARTKKSSISFLLLLVFWISFVFVVPRVGVMIASQYTQVPSLSEIESKKASSENSTWETYFTKNIEMQQKQMEATSGMSEAEREAFIDEKQYEWTKQEDALRAEQKKKIAEYTEKLNNDYNNKKEVLEKKALLFSRFSPASSYNLAVMNICGTDVGMKKRYETAIHKYKNRLTEFINKKKEEDGSGGGIRISVNSETGLTVNDGRKDRKLDVSEMPEFIHPEQNISIIYSSIAVDFGLLSIYILLAFGGAVHSFLKYDVR
ncbi:MAG: ABC transporter permease [Rhodothermaceae bacterium]